MRRRQLAQQWEARLQAVEQHMQNSLAQQGHIVAVVLYDNDADAPQHAVDIVITDDELLQRVQASVCVVTTTHAPDLTPGDVMAALRAGIASVAN